MPLSARHLALVALVFAALAAIAAGCGGSSGLSKDELAKKADAICREGRVSFARELGPNPASPPAIAAYNAGVLRITAPLEKRMRDLKPPKSEAATWKAYLEARRQNIELITRQQRAAAKGDQRGLQSIQRDQQAASMKRRQLASKLGLKVCGNPADVPNLLGPPQPAGLPATSVHYVKPKDTLDQAIARLRAAKTCDALHALQNSDDTKLKPTDCQGLLTAIAGLRVIAKDAIGPVGVVDINAKGGYGTVFFVEDAKDGRFTLSSVFGYEGGAIHKASEDNDALGNMSNAITALRRGNGSAFHAAISENSMLFTEPASTVAKLKNPTGSGARLVSDLKADPKAKPQTLAIDALLGFFMLHANNHNYVLFNLKGPSGYKFEGFYPQPAG